MEKILCSAIWYDTWSEKPHQPLNIESWYVACWYRHCSCICQWMNDPSNEKEQGFLTSKNRFVDRSEWFNIAEKAWQLNDNPRHWRVLYSENLY